MGVGEGRLLIGFDFLGVCFWEVRIIVGRKTSERN